MSTGETTIQELIMKVAEESPSWGCARIQGALILVGETSHDRAIREFVAHDQEERSHHGLGNGLIAGMPATSDGLLTAKERLGGLLEYYCRKRPEPGRSVE